MPSMTPLRPRSERYRRERAGGLGSGNAEVLVKGELDLQRVNYWK